MINLSILYREWLSNTSRELTSTKCFWNDMKNVAGIITIILVLPAFFCVEWKHNLTGTMVV